MDNKCGCCGISLFFLDDRCPNCLPGICDVAEEPSEEEKTAFFADIAAEEKRKIEAHDELVCALELMCTTYGSLAFAAGNGARICVEDWEDADSALHSGRAALAKARK